MSAKKRPSLLAALLWLGLGCVFLLRNFGIGPDLWYIATRYWPVLLILLGLGKVIDYVRQKQGVSLRFGEVFGILMILFSLTVYWSGGKQQWETWRLAQGLGDAALKSAEGVSGSDVVKQGPVPGIGDAAYFSPVPPSLVLTGDTL